MLFSSLTFLLIFLPVLFLAYFAIPSGRRLLPLKNAVALAASWFFYAWGEPVFVFWLILSTGFDFFLSRAISRSGRKSRKSALLLSIGLVVNLSVLFYTKYLGFALEQVEWISGMDFTRLKSALVVSMPIGISFFTFQKVSYLMDVWSGRADTSRSFLNYALYVALFPQLIAGPIVRYFDVEKQLSDRSFSRTGFFEGLYRFSLGLFRKVIFANSAGQLADLFFNTPNPSALESWIGAVAYMVQIYFDFAGYSDMAIGLGLMMGFRFLENFNQPYTSFSITDFWRRWHISLSNWMREYLYIPMGGNRKGGTRTVLNLWLVFLLSGLWHGASWNFVFWGGWHGLWLSIEKLFPALRFMGEPGRKHWTIMSLERLRTLLIVLIGWVFFRAETMGAGVRYIGSMLGQGSSESSVLFDPVEYHNYYALIMITLAGLIISQIRFQPVKLRDWMVGETLPKRLAYSGLVFVMMFASVSALSASSFNPFIYFRF